jgi:predicted glycosyltransferase
VLNLGNIQVKAMHPHKIAKAMWDAIKTMYENVDKAFVVILNQFFSELEIKEDETFTSFLTNFKVIKPINQSKRLPTLMKKQHYNSYAVY